MTTTATPLRDLNAWETVHFARQAREHPDTVDALNDMIAEVRALPAPGSCPDWCVEGDGHTWTDEFFEHDEVARVGHARYHTAYFGGKHVDVSVVEIVDADDGSIYTGPPDLRVWCEEPFTDPAQGLRLASALIEAHKLFSRLLDERRAALQGDDTGGDATADMRIAAAHIALHEFMSSVGPAKGLKVATIASMLDGSVPTDYAAPPLAVAEYAQLTREIAALKGKLMAADPQASDYTTMFAKLLQLENQRRRARERAAGPKV